MLLLLAFGCDMGPSADTVVDELRVLAALADPPEATPGEAVSLETLIVAPEDSAYDVMTWSCTFTGEGCIEAAGQSVWDGLSVVESPDSNWLSETATINPALSYAATDTPAPFVQRWTLACEPGLCEAIERALEDPSAGSNKGARLQEWLTDPTSFMGELPLEGASLALRSLNVSTRSEADRAQNPTIDCSVRAGFSRTLDVEGVVPFECEVTGEFSELAAVWGYATDGGWGGALVELSPGDTTLTYDWFAPEEPAEVDAWLIIVDGDGGVGIFETEFDVR